MTPDVDPTKRLDSEFDAARRDFIKARVRFLVLESLVISQEFPTGSTFHLPLLLTTYLVFSSRRP